MPVVGQKFFCLSENRIQEVEVLKIKSCTTTCFLRRPGWFLTEHWADVSGKNYYLTVDEALEDLRKKVIFLPVKTEEAFI